MARIIWTSQALDDVEAICKFIARDSNHYAHLFANKIIEKANIVESFPNVSRIVPESNQESIREILYGNYRIIYRILGDEAQILTVHHSSRLFDPSNIEVGQ